MTDVTFNLEKIDAVRKRGIEEGWSFPYLFNSLKALGIERYEVTVASHEIKYVGCGTSIVEGAPEGFSPVVVAATYSLDGLKSAIARSQAKEITFEQFLVEIAAAGVTFYRVDMGPRTVTYHGANSKKDKLVEKVPTTV